MLQVRNISKKLGVFQLSGISFDLPAGYIMGLVGPNAAGKTSLIKMILGLYRQDTGEIFIHRIMGSGHEKEVKNKIGFVLEKNYFPIYNTMLENAGTYGRYYKEFQKEEFLSNCIEFGIDPRKKLGKCSKGEVMKFQLAFALATQPLLLMMDEPTANFDLEFREVMYQRMVDFISDGKHSILYSTHVTDELDKIADYITFMNHGKLVFSLEKERMYEEFAMVSGEETRIASLGRENLIFMEKSKYQSKALVRRKGIISWPDEILIEKPTVEEVMYYVIKRERKDATDGY